MTPEGEVLLRKLRSGLLRSATRLDPEEVATALELIEGREEPAPEPVRAPEPVHTAQPGAPDVDAAAGLLQAAAGVVGDLVDRAIAPAPCSCGGGHLHGPDCEVSKRVERLRAIDALRIAIAARITYLDDRHVFLRDRKGRWRIDTEVPSKLPRPRVADPLTRRERLMAERVKAKAEGKLENAELVRLKRELMKWQREA